MMGHAYYLSYLGGGGRKNINLSPARAKIVQQYLRNKKIQTKGLGVWLKW
jgi:flagellar motor protein MotB